LNTINLKTDTQIILPKVLPAYSSCRKNNLSLPSHSVHLSAHRGKWLKGNQVKLLNRPATVSS